MICTVVFLGLPTAEYVRLSWGQLLVNLYINPKSIFMTLSPSLNPISMIITYESSDKKVLEEGKKT